MLEAALTLGNRATGHARSAIVAPPPSDGGVSQRATRAPRRRPRAMTLKLMSLVNLRMDLRHLHARLRVSHGLRHRLSHWLRHRLRIPRLSHRLSHWLRHW